MLWNQSSEIFLAGVVGTKGQRGRGAGAVFMFEWMWRAVCGEFLQMKTLKLH